MFECGPIFYANKQSKSDIIINQGGTDAGKTYAIMQLLYDIAVNEPAPNEDPIITIVGESVPNLKKGAYRIAKNILFNNPTLQSKIIKQPNETDRIIYFKSGWIMEFNSYETEQQAKQGKRQYLFVNEAQGISWPIFWQLAKKTRRKVFIDYNPTAGFWAHEKLIGTSPESNDLSAKVQLIISDHRHNPFLSQKDHDRTENIKDKERWWVYARGKTGNLIGLIHPNWKEIPNAMFPTQCEIFGGLDFGYTNDPTAGVKLAAIGNNIFAHELCYEPGLAPIKTKEIFFANGFGPENPVFCDHDPEQIAQLRRFGLIAIAANKHNGSVKSGILKVNEYNFFYTASSTNIDFERKRYMWMIDPATGKPLNVPVDGNDHLMNAIRYGVYTKFFRQGI